MKKLLIATAVVLLFAATASAVVVRTRTLISTRLKSVEFVFEYDRDTGALQEVNLRGGLLYSMTLTIVPAHIP